MGKSRAAAFAVGLQDLDEGENINTYSEYSDSDINETAYEGKVFYTCTYIYRIRNGQF